MSPPGISPMHGTQMYDLDGSESADEFFQSHESVLLTIFHPVAPHWLRFAPVYDKLANDLASSGSKVKCARLDASNVKNVELARKIGIARFPTLVLCNGPENFKIYHGVMRERDIFEFLRRQGLPSVVDVDLASLEKLRRENDIVVVAYAVGEDIGSRNQFAAIAQEMRDDYVFAITSDGAAAVAEGIFPPSIVVYKKVEELKTVLEGAQSEEVAKTFIKSAAKPLVAEIHPELHRAYLEGSTAALGYIFVASPEDEAAVHIAMLDLARKYSGKIQFGTVVGPVFESLVDDVHVKPDQWPSFAIHDLTSNLKYPLPSTWKEQIDAEEIEPFVEKFFAGSLEPTVKSQPVPEEKGPLIEVVGLTYKEVVLDNERDVLIEYYTEDCAPCEMLVPELEKLARAYAADEKGKKLVTIGKMNLDENDALDRDIRGFPWIKLYPAGKKTSPVKYSGDQRAVAWTKFIRGNGTHKVEVNV